MNGYSNLLGAVEGDEGQRVTGRWFNIRFTPDLATGERFNIGVAFMDDTQPAIQVRMLDHVERVRCLYGMEFAEDVLFMLKVVKSSIMERGTSIIPSPNIEYSDPKYASGKSVKSILERLYRNTVPLGRAVNGRHDIYRGSDNDSVRRVVFDRIRQRSDLKASQIIAENPFMLVDDGDKRLTLDIPLQGANRLGTIISAVYKSKDRAEINLLRGGLDLETARRVYRQDNLGLFIARPTVDPKTFPEQKAREIENVIDIVAWKMAKQRVHVEAESDLGTLSERIMAWAGI